MRRNLQMRTQHNGRYKAQKSVGVLLFVGFILAGVVTPPIYADTVTKSFEFGPGTPQDHSNYRTLFVPAFTRIGSVVVEVQRDAGSTNVPVVIEVHKASQDSLGTTGPDGPLAAPVRNVTATTSTQVITFSSSDPVPLDGLSASGCPSTWRVRVRTASGTAPPVRVFGNIVYAFTLPDPINVLLSGAVPIDLNKGGAAVTRNLQSLGRDDLTEVSGGGQFRIKAKWHTRFFSGGFTFFPLTVELRKPDGSLANSQTGFSQHAPTDKTPKVDFRFVVSTAEDLAMLLSSPWAVRVTPSTDSDILAFDINNDSFDTRYGSVPAVPVFNSTIIPGCNAVGSFDVMPSEATVAVHERLDYAFTWTVPAPLNWHDLEFLHLHLRDGADVILWVRFDEASRTFSLFNEATGQFESGFAAGSQHRLQTPHATLSLADTSVVGSGPTGPSVTLNLSLSFEPQAAGRTFLVEVAASDDQGNASDFFTEAGTLTVTPAPASSSAAGSGGCVLRPGAAFDPLLIGLLGLLGVRLSLRCLRKRRGLKPHAKGL